MRGSSLTQKLFLLTLFLAAGVETGFAAEKKVKSNQIRNSSFISSNKSYKIVCLGKTPGKTRKSGKTIYFNSFKDEQASLKRARKSKAVNDRLKLLKLLISEGGKACVYTN